MFVSLFIHTPLFSFTVSFCLFFSSIFVFLSSFSSLSFFSRLTAVFFLFLPVFPSTYLISFVPSLVLYHFSPSSDSLFLPIFVSFFFFLSFFPSLHCSPFSPFFCLFVRLFFSLSTSFSLSALPSLWLSFVQSACTADRFILQTRWDTRIAKWDRTGNPASVPVSPTPMYISIVPFILCSSVCMCL